LEKNGRQAPCEERLRSHVELLELVARTEPEQYYPTLRRIVLRDYWAYLRLILRYDWVDPWFHGEEIVRFLEENWTEAKLILVPRDHGKSTLITVPLPAYLIAADPFTSVMVVNATEDKAKQMTKAAAAIIQNNEIYKATFPDIIPDAKWGEGGYYINAALLDRAAGSIERIDAGIKGFGVRTNITGAHPDGGLILDDIINSETYKSATELERARSATREAITCVSGDRTINVIGTRWTYTDPYGDILEGKIVGPKGKFRVLKIGATRKNSQGQEELVWPRRIFVDLQGKVKEAGFTLDRLASEKINRGRLFSALFYNEPVLDENAHFDIGRVKTFSELPFEIGPVGSVCIETESQASALLSTMKMMMRDAGRVIRLEAIKSGKRTKEERIKSMLGAAIEEMRVNVRDTVWHQDKGLQSELRQFPRGHDDVIDASAYLCELCTDTETGGHPIVTIMCDPAFTENTQSDYTAIVAACKYNGEMYFLDVMKFQTDKAEVLIRSLFAMYDKMQVGAFKGRNRERKRRMVGFDAQAARTGRHRNKRSFVNTSFEVDLDSYYAPERKRT